MVTEAPSRGVVLVTSLFALSCICLILFVWSTIGGNVPLQAKGYRFKALFPDASQLNTHAVVRMSGVDVGNVVKIKQVGLRTEATIELDQQYAPLSNTARAILRQKTLLGETFIGLTPGSKTSGAIPDNGTMPAKNIGERQPLDRLLNALDEKTRKNLQTMLTGTSDSLRGRGEDLNAAFGDLDPATAELTKLVTILDHQRGSVRSLVRDSATVFNTISDRDNDLAGLVTNSKAVLAETAQRNRALTETVRALPGLTRQLRSTGVALDRTAQIADPTLQALRPAARYAPRALRQLSKLAPRATNLFRDFNRLVPSAEKALPAVAAITNAVTPFSESLYPLARELVPIINYLVAVKDNAMGSFATTGASLNNRPLASNGKPASQLRVVIPITEEGLTGDTERQGISRHNAYYGPAALNAVGREGLAASDCDNAKNANKPLVVGTGNIPCVVDPGWEFGGVKRYYPHLERLPPAK